jgi:hypothetical protein
MEGCDIRSPISSSRIKSIICFYVPMPKDSPFFVADNAMGGNISRHDSTQADYGAIAYCCPWRDAYVHSNPHIATYDHRFQIELLVIWKTISPVTMVECVESKIPAYMTIVAYPQSAFAFYQGIISYVHIITYHYILWRANYYSAMKANPLAARGKSRHKSAITL